MTLFSRFSGSLLALAVAACGAASDETEAAGGTASAAMPDPPALAMQEQASIDLPFEDWAHGLSGLAFEHGRHRLTAFSDRGSVFALDVQFDAQGVLSTVSPHTGTRAASDGKGGAMDMEAGLRLPGDAWLVSLERPNRLLVYPGSGTEAFRGSPGAFQAPGDLSAQPVNRGAEAMARLPDGRIVLIGEGAAEGVNPFWIGGPGDWMQLDYATEPGFAPVEAAPHPCGGLLVLERAANLLRGLTGRLTFVPASALEQARPGQRVVPSAIGTVHPSTGRGNFEGMTVIPDAGQACPGAIDVLVVSDDNKVGLLPRTLVQYRVSPSPSPDS